MCLYIYIYIWVLYWCNYLMSGYMVCANDDHLRFIYGGKFRGFKL